MADWRTQLLRTMGMPVTPQNMDFLNNWQRFEGGHTHNTATYNWLNTTRGGPGAIGEINSVGVDRYANARSGIAATAATLRNGRYGDILAGLSSGNPYKHNLSAGLSTWVSGSPTGNLAYAQKIMGAAGGGATGQGAPPPGRRYGGPAFAEAPSVRTPRTDFNRLPQAILASALQRDPRQQTLGIMGALLARPPAPEVPPPQRSSAMPARPLAAAATAGPGTAGGGGITLPLSYSPTHETSNLGWGTRSAIDIMGNPGSAVRAPLPGVILSWKPQGAQGGGSMLVRYANGKKQWLGHLAGGLAPGTQFGAGQRLAVISPDHPRPHVHVDTRR